ncbi:gamma-glutamyl kinase [Marinitoga sp. 1135]|uniref:Glutamate 5-kinase n=1 Tax=Marinitoga piezophila (strain DSM 14283 / JCM 11233 / KA3) TaxID=443254 RepID=H2J6R9_MARPK|nr:MULTISPECIES: glutamate 5-kinase [Marinitoga]AEX86350.1 glutamate 5-kinase [Marinitoga piezophila KA3]NUU96525.1 gamma-glutamyl kinase [Marinitoga sp. 1135]NUU98443.1 gamma-glutamyl kinase [Marinitoga sp. 1138]
MEKIVIKVGSNLLIKNNDINKKYIIKLSYIISELIEEGKKVVLVSSGANAAGLQYLKLHPLKSLAQKQALCAVGQVQLMKIYENAFDFHNKKIAQILLTADDFYNRKRFINLKNTLIGLNQFGIIPIINENDTISTDEIKFGDNDRLSSQFAIGWGADGLMLLTSVDGVLDENGDVIKVYDKNIQIKEFKKTSLGTGGISTKIDAGLSAAASGIKTCICNGNKLENIKEFVSGKNVGTVFMPDKKLKGKKAWIAFLSKSRGKVFINKGARDALMNKKSLLPVGIEKIEGNFEKGEPVNIYFNNKLIGKGIPNYSAEDAVVICGKKSGDIAKIGNFDYDEFIHVDNMVIF